VFTVAILVSTLVSGAVRKRAPLYNRWDLSHTVENSGGFAGVNGLSACGRMGKGFLVVMGVFKEVRSFLIDFLFATENTEIAENPDESGCKQK